MAAFGSEPVPRSTGDGPSTDCGVAAFLVAFLGGEPDPFASRARAAVRGAIHAAAGDAGDGTAADPDDAGAFFQRHFRRWRHTGVTPTPV
jgi:hypothetical protein